MIELQNYIEEVSGNKFQYGEWDCIQFILQWLRYLAGDDHTPHTRAVFSFLKESGYWGTVKDEASYKAYLDHLHVRSQRDLFHLFNRRGFLEAGKPQPGDIIISPDQALGLVSNDYKGLFLRRTEGAVAVPMPEGSKFLSCHL